MTAAEAVRIIEGLERRGIRAELVLVRAEIAFRNLALWRAKPETRLYWKTSYKLRKVAQRYANGSGK